MVSADFLSANALRVPEERFENLIDYPFVPHYVFVNDMRMHYVDEGNGNPILMIHGEPTWSYLYRHIIPPIVKAGFRAVVPDHIGFGKSDKYKDEERYTFDQHYSNLEQFVVKKLDLKHITLVCQDWGGPLGLRLVNLYPDRFDKLVIMNTDLFSGLPDVNSPKLMLWRERSQERINGALDMGTFMKSAKGHGKTLSEEEMMAYSAPFPDIASRGSARRFPLMIPASSDSPGSKEMEETRIFLRTWNKPTLLIFGEDDFVFPPNMSGKMFLNLIPTVKEVIKIRGGTHYIQESDPEKVSEYITNFLRFT